MNLTKRRTAPTEPGVNSPNPMPLPRQRSNHKATALPTRRNPAVVPVTRLWFVASAHARRNRFDPWPCNKQLAHVQTPHGVLTFTLLLWQW